MIPNPAPDPKKSHNSSGSDSKNPDPEQHWSEVFTRDERGSGLDRTGQDWSQFWPDQDWIGLRKFLLF